MNSFLITLFIIITLIITLLIFYIFLYNKITESIIRIEEAESRIDNNLRDKYDLLNRSISLFRNIIELDQNAFKDIIKLRESDEIFKVSRQLEIINDELLTLRNYYNANITNYNKMIKKFPTNIVASIKKYKERPFYDLKDMTDEDYEDFKL